MRSIQGSCHCGIITFELGWPANNPEIPARACTCTFCVKHGGVWTSNPASTLTIRFEDAMQVSEYAFGTKTATFHVCRQCGVVPVVTSNIEGRTHAVVSVNALNDVDPSTLKPAPISFDGEGVGDRLSRRQRNWIADVRFT